MFSDITHSKYPIDAKDFYKQLDTEYPGSKFILNIRNVDKWIKSRLNHEGGFIRKNHLEFYNLTETDLDIDKLKTIWRETYFNHIHDVERYFVNRDSDLIIYDIENDPIDNIVSFFKGVYNLDATHYEHVGRTNYDGKDTIY